MPVDARPSVLVVAGMHRSGTSFLASLLRRGGCRMGEMLLPGDANNRPGYFEDLEFLNLNRRMLAETVPTDAPGARCLVRTASDNRARGCGGWKDPRTSVLLDFWNARVPDARYVFVYRSPWDVADSTQRLGAAVF